MTRTLRRHWLQVGTLGVVIAALVVLWLVGGRSGSSGFGAGPAAASSAAASTPRVSPTPDPREEQVRQAAMAYVQAFNDAFKTGSSEQLGRLTVEGSQARGNAGIPAHIVRHNHKTFVVTAIAYRQVSVTTTSVTATAVLSYSLTGYDAAWPSLTRTGADHTMGEQNETLDMQLNGAVWLVDAVH